jgi:hypothetical protein
MTAENERQIYERVIKEKYEESARDRVKGVIMNYCYTNPAWTPEDLLRLIKQSIKHFGLNNRYLPPDFGKKEDGNTDTGGTVPSVEATGG